MSRQVIRRVDGKQQKIASILVWLQLETMPHDPVIDPADGFWWLVYEGNNPIAFAGMTSVQSWPKAGYIARVGVLPECRGKGLQKRLLSVCERAARRIGWRHLISTTYCNPPSANSFIARKFKTYEPQARWGAEDTIYWIKSIN